MAYWKRKGNKKTLISKKKKITTRKIGNKNYTDKGLKNKYKKKPKAKGWSGW